MKVYPINRIMLPAIAALLVLQAVTAYAGVSIRHFVGFGLYPYGASDTVTTTPGTGLLANNGSGRALVQLIYAGPDGLIDEVDLDNGLNGFVSGDDSVWQSTVIETGVNHIDEWGFSSTLRTPYTDWTWATGGYGYIRVFQDETPQLGEAYTDSDLQIIDTTVSSILMLPQNMALGGDASGIALDRLLVQPTNIVRTIPAGEWDLMSVPVWVDPTNTFGEVGDSAAVNSYVYFYEPSISNFFGGMKSAKGWGAAEANRVILPGESFFLNSDIYSDSIIDITGTVPTTPITNQVNDRWSALGYPFPVAVTWTDTSLSSNLPVGTLVYFWNMPNQQYDILLKGPPSKGGWGAEGDNMTIQPGDGFFVRQPPGSTAFEWVVQP